MTNYPVEQFWSTTVSSIYMQALNAQTTNTYAAMLKSLRRSTVHFNDSDILAPLDSFACTKQVLLHRLVHLTVHAG